MRIEPAGGRAIALVAIGDVHDVLEGRVPPGSESLWFDATPYSYGFMSGSTENMETSGELLLWEGRVYVKATKTDYPIESGPSFVSTSSVMIRSSAKAQFRIPPQEVDLSWEEVLLAINDTVPNAFLVAGSVRFAKLRGKFLLKAPIYGESAFSHESPPCIARDVSCRAVGCAAGDSNALETLKVVLYRHPKDPGPLIAHTHVAVVPSLSTPTTPETVSNVLHLFSDSKATFVDLSIFPINSVEPCSPKPKSGMSSESIAF